ncbi:hypothetical protein lerEdw1_002160 [Lerista edwardsae]|nr:hypothetical protein lerEdw1_002160 [Lerista edwardsae]
MAAPHFFYSLFLILLIQIVLSQPTEGKSLMMQKLGTGIQDVLQTLLEKQSSKEAPLNSEGHWNSPFNLPPKSFPGTAKSRSKRRTWERSEERECRLRSLLVHIKDLGLGYNSEETILFKYCSGSCPKARSNHDLTLSILLQKSEIPGLGDPCCRPTHYENVAFLDDSNQWHEVEKLSASACSCVG